MRNGVCLHLLLLIDADLIIKKALICFGFPDRSVLNRLSDPEIDSFVLKNAAR